MAKRNVATKREQATLGPVDPVIALEVVIAERKLTWQRMRHDVMARMKNMVENLTRKGEWLALEEVGAKNAVNPLGEIQRAGQDIDRLCAQLEMIAQEIARLQEVLAAFTATPA